MALARKFNKIKIKKEDILDDVDKTKEFHIKYKNVTLLEKNKKSVETFLEESTLPSFLLTSIDFSVMSRNDIDKLSTCDIKNINKNFDLTFSVDDPRLGTIENNKLCATCDKTNEECPGHLGIITLPTNFIHPFFREIVIKVLESICFSCNKLLITEQLIKDKGFNYLKGVSRLRDISNFCKKERCINPDCGGGVNPKFKTTKAASNENRMVFYTIKKGKLEEEHYLTVDTVKSKLDCISEKDAILLGFHKNHPRNFIIDFVPVIPLSARPWIMREGETKDDYITSAYLDILSKKIESFQYDNKDDKEEKYKSILFFYDHLIRNCDQAYTRSPRDICKSIADRIVHKEGLIRKHLMGKRCDYTARSPLGPNRSINFGFLAPPEKMKDLTIPEMITQYNYEYLKELANKGNITYICPKKGNLSGRKLKFDISKHNLFIGDKIGRKVQNNDIVLFNRQPTLHKQSMLGYLCHFQDKESIGVHLSSTSGLNADFDGDEGNIHVVQTISAQVEARLVMSATNCIMSSSNSVPVASLVYNSISGAYLLTSDDLLFTKEEFEEGLDSIYKYTNNNYVRNNYSTIEDRLDNIKKYSGKALCSVLFPPDFWYKNHKVIISEGILRNGRLKKNDVGSSENSIIQCLWKRYGQDITSNFISDANFLFNWYLLKYGFTVGISDCMPTTGIDEFNENKFRILKELNEELYSVNKLREDATNLEFEEKEERERILCRTAGAKIQDKANKLLKSTNTIKIMCESGAKGSALASSQLIVGSLGQAFVNNKRPEKKITNDKRWLTTFSVDDNSPESRGFAVNSYFEGLGPNEFFAQAQAGRITVMDTAIKTSDVGYMQRKMIKAQEDLIISYDGGVRNQTGIIFQFCYGAGFSTQNMVLDKTDEGSEIYSFFNTKNLCGRINSDNGFGDYNLEGSIFSIFNEINNEYGEIFTNEPKTPDVEGIEDPANIDNTYEFTTEEDFTDLVW